MHLGNLSFRVAQNFQATPAYDMLPMMYAPLPGGEVPPREFRPRLPSPQQRDVWLAACSIALDFWRSASTDTRISEPFRALCAANLLQLTETVARV
jgi:hypothetical protein